jgi:transposase
MRGRPKDELTLLPNERGLLVTWSKQADPQLATRARVVLLCADGKDNKSVAAATGVGEQTVSRWRRRFLAERMDGLVDQPRSGAPSRISLTDVQRTIHAGLAKDDWTTRELARQLNLSQSTVSRILRAFGLNARRSEPAFFHDISDVVGVWTDVGVRIAAVTAGVAEASPVAVLGTKKASPKALPLTGRPADRLDSFLNSIHVAAGEIYLVVHMADAGTLIDPLWRWLTADPHHHLHFVPDQAAWLRLVDRWFAHLTGAPLNLGLSPPVDPTPPSLAISRYLALQGRR